MNKSEINFQPEGLNRTKSNIFALLIIQVMFLLILNNKNSFAESSVENNPKDDSQYKIGSAFKKAEEYYNREEYAEAAEAYIRVANEYPHNEYLVHALFNGAICYENLKRYKSAMNVFERIYIEHGHSEQAPEALYRIAKNGERFFDFDKAIESYLLLCNDKREIYRNFENRANALYRAAVLLELIGDLSNAVIKFEEFVKTYPEDPRTPKLLYQAGLVYEKMGDGANMDRVFKKLRKNYGKSGLDDLVIESLGKTGDWYWFKKNNTKLGKKYHTKVIREFDSRNLPVSSLSATWAAKAQFYLVEQQFEKWNKIRLVGSSKAQQKALKKKLELLSKLETEYKKVHRFAVKEWNIASRYRIGNLYQRLAESLYEAEVPSDIAYDPEQEEMYQVLIEDYAMPFEEEAIKNYETVIKEAREEKIVNKWTVLTLKELSKYKPSEYPEFKEPKEALMPISLGQQDFEKTILNTRQSLGEHGENEKEMLSMGLAYLYLGKPDLAELIFKDTANLSPDNAEIDYYLSRIYLDKNLDHGIVQLQAALEKQPDFVAAHNDLGVLYSRKWDYKRAVTEFDLAIKHAPDCKEAYLNKGNALKNDFDILGAEEAFKMALSVEPNYPDAFFNLGILYLDREITGMDTIVRLQQAISYFGEYKVKMGARKIKDDPVDEYINEATRLIEMEKERRRIEWEMGKENLE